MNTDSKNAYITLDHGAGGKIAHELISKILLPLFDNPVLSRLDDGAVLEAGPGRVAFSTDTFVVSPLFFPGGNIGDLAVNGTVNDVAMCGAVPLALSCGLVVEEGFPMADFERILNSMAAAARTAGVSIVTGDTKVVPGGAADGIFINTSGLGRIPEGVTVSAARAAAGDRVILSGTMADHGMTILTRREGLQFDSPIQSDSAALNHLTAALIRDVGDDVHVLRDPTRGGVGTTLNEIAEIAGAGIRIYEERLPVHPSVAGVCELLGFDPLYVANEGKMLVFVPENQADRVLEILKADPLGTDACVIGEVVTEHPGRVFMQTLIGGTRVVDMLTGEQLPRIC
ncbi:MAG: hydrogenase expression/formation protein HypE [Desulfobacterales bacterium]|nr:MAG: hydrogenase expression/formation protein HypE [Desulfobacterales bacterium]